MDLAPNMAQLCRLQRAPTVNGLGLCGYVPGKKKKRDLFDSTAEVEGNRD